MPTPSLQQIVQECARAAGFHLSGVAPADLRDSMEAGRETDGDEPAGERLGDLSYLDAWIAEGRAGEMEYLKRRDADGTTAALLRADSVSLGAVGDCLCGELQQ